MHTKQIACCVCAACAALTAAADGWRFSAGPAWRSRVKTEIRGAVAVPTLPPAPPAGYDRPDPSTGAWSPDDVTETRPDPSPIAMPDDELWAISRTYTEVTVEPGDGAALLDATDTRGPLGLKARLGRDVWELGPVSVGFDLRFAGYWGIRSSASGFAAGGSRTTYTCTDWYLFEGGPWPDDPEPDNRDFSSAGGVLDPVLDPASRVENTATETFTGHRVGARLRADLYQIGLGPTVSWRVFRWLDAYAGAAALCNIAALDFTCSGTSVSETQCRLGFGADVGLVANMADWLGLYADVGYEWVDDFDVSAAGVRSTMDFSSLVVSAGIVLRF